MNRLKRLEELREYIQIHYKKFIQNPPLFIFITGASGSGKTYLTSKLQEGLDSRFIEIAFFDRIGVPSLEEMTIKYGSGEKWQEISTHNWIRYLASLKDKALLILEGQFNPYFAAEGCQQMGIPNYIIINIHTEQSIRENRLRERGHPELANETMENWARVLKEKTLDVGGVVIENSSEDPDLPLTQIAELLWERVKKVEQESSHKPLDTA